MMFEASATDRKRPTRVFQIRKKNTKNLLTSPYGRGMVTLSGEEPPNRKQKEAPTVPRRAREMAIATEEITDQTTDQTDSTTATEPEQDETTAKRERVDLETLDPNAKVVLQITMPAGLKLKLTQMAEAEKLNVASFTRDYLAKWAEYEIPASFLERARTHKYATEEEAKAAQKEKAKTQRENMKKVLALLASGQIQLPEGVELS